MVDEEKGCTDASGAIARLQDKGHNHAFANENHLSSSIKFEK